MKRKQLDSRCCILVKFRNLHGMEKKLQIRNSTVEFLTFVLDGKEDGVQVLYKDDTIWATQNSELIIVARYCHDLHIYYDVALHVFSIKEATISGLSISSCP